jgi:putative oxidoreductase
MLKRILKTFDSWSLLVLRVILGIVIFAHGAQKLFGWFGGYGFAGSMTFFTEKVGMPWLLGLGVILLETFGAILLLAGLATRVMALFFSALAIGIVLTTHIQNGFFMNWFGNLDGEGYEYFLLWLSICVTLMISGGGALSIDKKISEFLNK